MTGAEPPRATAPSPVIAVLLAAGGGQRMGQPKALVPLAGAPLALRVAERYVQCGVRPVLLVVASQHGESLRAAAVDMRLATEIEWIEGAPADAPMMESVRRGLRRAIECRALCAFVQPVDAGPPSPAVLAALQLALREPSGASQAVKPTHRGRGGHPLLLTATACALIEAGSAATLRDALWTLGSHRIARVEFDDRGVLANWNRPEDLPRGG